MVRGRQLTEFWNKDVHKQLICKCRANFKTLGTVLPYLHYMYSIMYTEIKSILFKNQINTAITSATLFLQNNNFSFPANLLYTKYKLANNF